MQRQLYPALLLITIALGAALYLRPTVGDELMALTGARGGETTMSYGQAGSGAASGYASQATVFPQAFSAASSQRSPTTQSSPPVHSAQWPVDRAGRTPESGEAVAGDVPFDSPSLPGSYPQAGATNQWPRSGSPAGPSYPVAGSPGNDPPPDAAPNPYPAAGGATPPWGDVGGLDPYPTAGAPSVSPDSAPPLRPTDPGASYGAPPPYAGPAPPVTSPTAGPTQPGQPTPAQPQRKPCEGAQVLAWVGDDVILASEVMPDYQEIMSRIPKSQLASRPQDRLEFEKKALIAKILQQRIETKLLCQEAKRTIPEEGLPDIKRKIAKHFEEKELPRRIEKAGVTSRQALDEKLRAIGSSVDRMKRAYIEQSLAYEWLRQQKGPDPKVSHQQMLDYYEEHAADFETPARARWEKLAVRKPRYGDPQEARARLAQMGNQVIRGISMADALKAQPQGDLQCEGGVQGWVTQGNFEVSRGLEQAIFGLPVGKLSRIFEDGDFLYIVRVLQREEFQRTPFEDPEVQKQIREKLEKTRRKEQVQEYLAKLREEIPVRTVFDDDPELAELRRHMGTSRE